AEHRQLFVSHASELRLRMQALLIEKQRRHMADMLVDAQMEGTLRASLRRSWPYMDAFERTTALKALVNTSEQHRVPLETQLGGMDLFSSVEYDVLTMSDAKPLPEVTDKIKE